MYVWYICIILWVCASLFKLKYKPSLKTCEKQKQLGIFGSL